MVHTLLSVNRCSSCIATSRDAWSALLGAAQPRTHLLLRITTFLLPCCPQGIGCNVLAYDIRPSPAVEALGIPYMSLDEMLPLCDIITLHCPLLPSTHHIIGKERITAMKPGTMLINVSRGGLVDSDALFEGLETGQLGGLGMDVYENEGTLFFEDFTTLSSKARMKTWDRRCAACWGGHPGLTSLANMPAWCLCMALLLAAGCCCQHCKHAALSLFPHWLRRGESRYASVQNMLLFLQMRGIPDPPPPSCRFRLLLSYPQVLVTPHSAFLTHEALKNIADTTIASLKDFALGRPLACEVKPPKA